MDSGSGNAVSRIVRGSWRLPNVGVLVPLILLWIALALSTNTFLTLFNLNNIAIQVAVIGALALGTTPAIICREIDLSIGAIEGLCAVIAGICAIQLSLPWGVAIMISLATGALVGILNGAIVVYLGVPSFVTTLAMLGIISGISLTLTGGQSLYGFPDNYQWLGQGKLLGIGVPVFIGTVILIAAQFMMRSTILGLAFYSVGGNDRAAALVGVPVRRTKIIAFMLSGLGAAIAGVLVSARLNSANPTYGTLDLLDAIAAVVIGGVALSGGVGTAVGTATGVLLIVTIRNGLNLLGVNPFIQQTAIGGMILIAALIDHLSRAKNRGSR